jgi:Putative zinc-finger
MCEETVIDMDGERDLKGAVRDLARAMEKGQNAHPAHDELLGYAAGALDTAEQDRIEDHLALCRECARTVLDLSVLSDGGLEEEPLPESVLAAEWARLRRAAAPAPPSRFRSLAAAVSPALPYALAASLLLAVGLGWRTVRLGEEVRQLSAPRSDVYVADLVPTGSGSPDERGAPEAVHPPAWASRVVLILAFAGPASHPEYAVELAAVDGRPLWSRRGLRPGPDGTFALEVPRQWLPPGTYRIRLSGLRGAAAQEVARYELRIEPGS